MPTGLAAAAAAGAGVAGLLGAAAVAKGPLRSRLRRALAWLFSRRELWVYCQPTGGGSVVAGDPAFRIDAWTDLNSYRPAGPGDAPTERVHADAAARRQGGAHLYSLVEGDEICHYSWLMTRGEAPGVEFQPPFVLPAGAAFLWDDYTRPSARGRGYHSASLRRRLRDASEQGCRIAYIAVAHDNVPSRRNIERAGFVRCARVRTTTLLGRARSRVLSDDGAR